MVSVADAEQPARCNAGAGVSSDAVGAAPAVEHVHEGDSTGKRNSSGTSSLNLAAFNFGTLGGEQGEICAYTQPENVLDGHPQNCILVDWHTSGRDHVWQQSHRSSTTGESLWMKYSLNVQYAAMVKLGRATFPLCCETSMEVCTGQLSRDDQTGSNGGTFPLPALRELSLACDEVSKPNRTVISSPALQCLEKLRSVEWLNLDGRPVDLPALDTLSGALTRLTYLSLDNCYGAGCVDIICVMRTQMVAVSRAGAMKTGLFMCCVHLY